MLRLLLTLLFASLATSASAQDACSKFKWKLESEHALLTSAHAAKTASGAEFTGLPAAALELKLEPAASAKLPTPPERALKQPNTYAGFVRVSGLAKPGAMLVTLSAEAWIDVVQDGKYVKSGAFSGVHDCATMRKSVKFELAPGPVVIQLSAVAADTVKMTLTPAAE